MLMLTTAQFDRTRRLALALAGIQLGERHRELLGRRCARLAIRGGLELDALLDSAERGELLAAQRLVELVTTNVTSFFRHPWHFDVAAEHALWAIHRRGRARLWSAAAATGEEPYSLAMALIEVLRRDDAPVTVLATDVDESALEVARRGEYSASALLALDPARRARFVATSTNEAASVTPEVRRWVEFRALNLVAPDWPVTGPFDVIFCRNVVMYLEPSLRASVLERLGALLAPNGLLILDPAEHLGPAGTQFTQGAEGVYSRRRAGAAGRDHRPRSRIES